MSAEQELARWNRVSVEAASTEIMPCNGSHAWVSGLVARRPRGSVEELFATADEIWWKLPEEDWREAFDSHPRIGERHAKAASEAGLRWSAGEQSSISEEDAVRGALVEGNRRYEERFGRVFIVCATGKSSAEILTILEARLGNGPEAELREAAEQQRRISQLRLRKWLGLPAARCEDV